MIAYLFGASPKTSRIRDLKAVGTGCGVFVGMLPDDMLSCYQAQGTAHSDDLTRQKVCLFTTGTGEK